MYIYWFFYLEIQNLQHVDPVNIVVACKVDGKLSEE
jgi:hypothetical protein